MILSASRNMTGGRSAADVAAVVDFILPQRRGDEAELCFTDFAV